MSGFNGSVRDALILFLDAEYGIDGTKMDFNTLVKTAAENYVDLGVDRSWGDPIAEWTYSSSVANVDFLDLGSYRELLIIFEGVTSNTGGTDALSLRVSTDNGATFATTNYVSIGSGSTVMMPVAASVATATPQGGILQVFNLNVSTLKARVLSSAGAEAATAPAVTRIGSHTAATNNALRFLWLTGANFSSGSIRIYGRKG